MSDDRIREAINKPTKDLVDKQKRELETWVDQQIALLNKLKGEKQHG